MISPPTAERQRHPVAAYLRSYPADYWQMRFYERSLTDLAARLDLPEPLFFNDNGYRANTEKPALSSLLQLVTAGTIETVLIPGPFVFALAQGESRAVVDKIRLAGCEIVELERPADPTIRQDPTAE